MAATSPRVLFGFIFVFRLPSCYRQAGTAYLDKAHADSAHLR